uniref:glycoside hydrolase family 3 protein n=1 Tax=uncultured Sphingomonas sp. TaxID=158754 RepID=UPI0035CC502D
MIAASKLEAHAALTAGATMWTTHADVACNIPEARMSDGPMGIAGARVDERDVSLLTPAPIALGASWDVDLVERVGRLVGGEAVRRDVDLVLAPNLNLARSPLAGRAFEYFSEDPLLAGMLGSAWSVGVQSTGTGSIAKHLVCNDSETERDRMNSVVDQRTLREVYLLPFEFAAAAACGGMLTAYNRVNGAWCSESREIITDIVKQEWRFGGAFMSDWFGTHSTAGCLNGGLDIEMPGPARFLGAKSAAAVAAGEVPAARVEDAADRAITLARRFTGDKSPPVGDDEADELLIETAAAGFTLIRNTGRLLPLDPTRAQRIAVIGPNASAPCFQGGTFAKIAIKPDAILPIDAIRARFGNAALIYEVGVDPQPRLPRMPVTPARDLGDKCRTGMTVDYFDTPDLAGTPVASETRDTNSLTWFFGVHEAGAFQARAGTRASGRFTAAVAGEHRLYIGGTGAVRLLVDGAEILRRDDEVAASDVMGKLKSGDADVAAVHLEAGQTIEITAELRYAPARCQGLWYGLRAPDTAEAMMARAVAAAADADVVLLIVGETSDASVESKDRADTRLPKEQIALIERVLAANPRTIVITNVGHAFDTSWGEAANAILHCWYPGQEFGRALAQVLAGDREPGGRMPVSIAMRDADYPAFALALDAAGDLEYAEGTRIGYRGLAANGTAPREAFGSGFGYADFTLTDIAVEPADDGGCAVWVTVRNVAARKGAEVVQVYRDVPELTLIGFAKVTLEPGESRRVSISIALRRLQIWAGGWVPIPGGVTLLVGRSSVELPVALALPTA